jgi:hypothetical protein
VSTCEDDERWDPKKARCVPKGNESGFVTLQCGCYGPAIQGARLRNTACTSGWEIVSACAAFCYGGGYQWGKFCE